MNGYGLDPEGLAASYRYAAAGGRGQNAVPPPEVGAGVGCGGRSMKLSCDMTHDCEAPVTHIDDSGFAYCTTHGIQRRDWRPCRKLRPWELRKLQRGEQLARY